MLGNGWIDEYQASPMETRPPKDMNVAEIEAEIQQQSKACEAFETELRALYLALDEATFRLREARSRFEILRTEIARRKGV